MPHKNPKPVPQQWEQVEASRVSAAKTLYVNIKSIRGLMTTDIFSEVATTETFESTRSTLELLSTKYLDRIKALAGGHAAKKGPVGTEELHEFMYYMQQYHDLTIDIAAAATQLSKVLINLREQLIKPTLQETQSA